MEGKEEEEENDSQQYDFKSQRSVIDLSTNELLPLINIVNVSTSPNLASTPNNNNKNNKRQFSSSMGEEDSCSGRNCKNPQCSDLFCQNSQQWNLCNFGGKLNDVISDLELRVRERMKRGTPCDDINFSMCNSLSALGFSRYENMLNSLKQYATNNNNNNNGDHPEITTYIRAQPYAK